MKKQRILLITRNLPPLVGGMERLNWHMADELSEYAEVKVVGPTGAAEIKPKNVQVLESPLKPLGLFMLIALCKAFWTAVCFKPNVIIAGSGLTAPLVWLISKLTGAKSVVYLHGFDITAAHWVYQKIWGPFFKRMDCVIVNSTPTKVLALNAGILEKKMSIVHPGVTLPVSAQSSNAIQSFKKKYNLEHKKILLSVGRLTTRKGLKEFVENSLAYIVQQEPDVVLVVVGESPKNSLGAGLQTREEILEVARKNQIENHILFLGVITDNEQLATIYEAADVHVFPVRHIPDDPEGFGMVAIEAAAHGLPTVAFATGGIVDAVKDGTSGCLVEKNNYMELTQQVLFVLNSPFDRPKIEIFSKKFAWENFGQAIYNLINDIQLEKKRQAHAVLDISSRIVKAKKIEILLQLRSSDKPLRILEVGCGSGGIAHYFAIHEQLKCEVSAVDVYDNRLVWDSYNFQKVSGVELPFSSNSFDVVITNHVIEHVGDWDQQLLHIKEIQRVLTPTGQGYLAVPNRWMITEPHYQLKFLSWLPKNWRSTYLKLWRKGNFYDCEPFCLSELETLLKQADVTFENLSVQATKVTLELEKPNSFINIFFKKISNNVLSTFKPIIPTLIYKIQPKNNEK